MTGQPILIEHSHTDLNNWPWHLVSAEGIGVDGWMCDFCSVFIRDFPPHAYIWGGGFSTRCMCRHDQADPCHTLTDEELG